MNVSAAILAGGRSTRMGADKSLLLLAGRPVIQHVIARAALPGAAVILIANTPEKYAAFGLPVFPDALPGKGALGGLYTALRHSPTAYTLCVACDMPLLSTPLLAYLAGLREGYDAVVPLVGGLPEPLHAVYSRNCLAAVWQQVARDDLRIANLFDRVRTRTVDEADLRRFDPDLRSFENINTPDDLARLQRLWE